MRPILFELFGVPVYAYSAFAVLAYLAALAWAWIEARRRGLDLVHVADLSLYLFIFGFVGARLLFVVVYPQVFADDWVRALKIWQGGFIFYGGLAGAIIAGLIYLRWHRLPLGTWSDLAAPSAMIGLAVGRIGCFLNGCCYGRITPEGWPQGLPFSVKYPPQYFRSLLDLDWRYPSPLYESAATIVIFAILVIISRRAHKPGQVLWTMILLYGIARFGLEFLRGDDRGTIPLLALSTSQAISLAGIIIAAIALFWTARLRKRPQETKIGPG